MAEASTPTDEHVVVAPPFAVDCADFAAEGWRASFEHPFVLALADGSLDAARFRFYQMQDARYLEAFADACSIISTRIDEPEPKLWFIDAARLAIVVEQQLHAGYGEKLGYTPADIRSLELTPNNRAYRDHMISCALRGSLVEAIAAITPCPWLYTDLGQHLQSQLGAISPDHPYADWLNTYADPAF
ncbi:MAG: thiaminase II, partial [Rhodothermales bacterium]|nr:thiaminase II [Rhodothermales bacterium]